MAKRKKVVHKKKSTKLKTPKVKTPKTNYTKTIANLAGAAIPMVSNYLTGGKLQLPAVKFNF